MPAPITIRRTRAADLGAIFDIYDREALHGIATFDTEPKTPEQRRAWLESHTADPYPAIVAEQLGAVVGWASLSKWSERCAYARAAEESVYIHHDHRGRGIGRALMADLVPRARGFGLGVLLARIAEPNPASVRLHESVGFETIGVMRRVGEKFGRILDVRLMDLHLDR